MLIDAADLDSIADGTIDRLLPVLDPGHLTAVVVPTRHHHAPARRSRLTSTQAWARRLRAS